MIKCRERFCGEFLMFRPNIYVVSACLAFALLTACGTKGPLYIPEQRYPQKEPAQDTPNTSPSAPLPDKAY